VDFAQTFLEHGGVGVALHAELGVTVDDREQVVEIVRDAAGQRAEAFHLLRLAQLVFEFFALGDIFPQTEEIRDLAAGATHAGNLDRLPHRAVVAAMRRDFAAPLTAGEQSLRNSWYASSSGWPSRNTSMLPSMRSSSVWPLTFGELRVHILRAPFEVGNDDRNGDCSTARDSR